MITPDKRGEHYRVTAWRQSSFFKGAHGGKQLCNCNLRHNWPIIVKQCEADFIKGSEKCLHKEKALTLKKKEKKKMLRLFTRPCIYIGDLTDRADDKNAFIWRRLQRVLKMLDYNFNWVEQVNNHFQTLNHPLLRLYHDYAFSLLLPLSPGSSNQSGCEASRSETTSCVLIGLLHAKAESQWLVNSNA